MDISIILIALGLLIFLSHIFGAAFAKTKVPTVLLLMLIGLVLGPITGLITPESFGKVGSVFTTITLICILFQSGTTLDLHVLGKSIGPALIATILNFVVIVGISVLLGMYMLDLKFIHCCFLGAALGGTSAAVVIPMVNQLKPSEKASTVLNLEAALSDIVCLIIAMSLLESFGTGDIDPAIIAKDIALSVLGSLAIGVIVGFAWIVILKNLLSGLQNAMFTTFALAFIVYGFTNLIGLNGGMAILAFGISAANYHISHVAKKSMAEKAEAMSLDKNDRNFYSEIVFILQTYFFVYVGISIKFNNWRYLLVGALFTALIFLTRFVTMSCMGKKGFSKRDRRLMRVLGPKGLVAAVLSSLPLQWAQATHQPEWMLNSCQAIQDVAYAVVLFSILTCSVIIILTERKGDKEEPASDEAAAEPATEPAAEVAAEVADEAKEAMEAVEAVEAAAPAQPESEGSVPEDSAPSSSSYSDIIPE
ncbi:MAG: cation:proton antiporter [Bacteroidales bacterium]|nr:cation:proton antiporter [Bacteroidales bacterium]